MGAHACLCMVPERFAEWDVKSLSNNILDVRPMIWLLTKNGLRPTVSSSGRHYPSKRS